ncbi:serine/threonine protein kinase [Candidatus Poribacteria bacterium]|nr:serine/threonine protein kinase [Candidatus Poribacteria bacterium]
MIQKAARPAASERETEKATLPITPPGPPSVLPPRPVQGGVNLPEDFRVLGRLGQGGMGVVLRVHQRSLDREVAVKILPSRLAGDPAHQQLFLREARLCAQLRHPNIVQIHQVGTLADGSVFFVMELMEGKDLARAVKDGGAFGRHGTTKAKRSIAEALRILFDLCDALEVAHDHGIIHRDLKPQNVMIEPTGRARLMDFGIALFKPEAQTGAFLAGTPAYMAPEQASGGNLDHRADIYALGGVLFFLLTGDQPRTGKSLSEILAGFAAQSPLPPERWKLLPEDTPPALRQVLRQMLSVEPDHRYASIADTRAALERVYLGLTGAVALRRRRRVRMWMGAAAGLLFLAAAGTVTVTLLHKHSDAQARQSDPATVSRVMRLTEQLEVESRRPDLPSAQRQMYANWLADIGKFQTAGNIESALQVAELAERYIGIDQVKTVWGTLQALAAGVALPPELKARYDHFADEMGELSKEPGEAKLAELRAEGMSLVTEVQRLRGAR